MCLADTRVFLPGLNLAYTDRASMAASVEVRVPFVDPIVAQAAFSHPGSAKIRGRQGKVALKRAAERWLPKEIVYGPKASFSAPLRAWVSSDLREVINDVLVAGEIVKSGGGCPAAPARPPRVDRAGRRGPSQCNRSLIAIVVVGSNAPSRGGAAARAEDAIQEIS